MCALGLCMGRTNKSEQTAAGTPPVPPGADVQAVKAEALIPATDAQIVNAAPVPESNATVSGSRT
jgi:hypothetical protein